MRISDWSSDLCSSDLIGPHGLGLLGNTENIMALAEIGIVLLLFIIGLELHPSRLMRLRRDIFGLGLEQVVVSGILLEAGIYFVTGFSIGAAIAVGLPLALSSTAQVLPMRWEERRWGTECVGRCGCG